MEWVLAAVGVVLLIAIWRLRSGPAVPRPATPLSAGQTRIVPDPLPATEVDQESLDVWGFRDTTFRVNERGHVEVTGSRYSISGDEMPNLLPWIQGVMGVEIDPKDLNPPHYPPEIPSPRTNGALLDALEGLLSADQITDDPATRLRHGHGHTQEEMYSIKYGTLPRVPDLVVYPTDEAQVSGLVEAALLHEACLIPYGGGTNVTDALRCPEDEDRVIVSVDMRRMNQVLWIDPTNRMACIQAGAAGRHIVAQLERYGVTMGHEPDSVEFSTLGGWIATHASGMKKNRYGNIEDIVLDFNVVTSDGKIERTTVAPRESIGADPRRSVLGSEGNLGIITSAVVKLFPLPAVAEFDSVLFPDFESGVKFMYDLTQSGQIPASVRLVDNMQFQFGQSLKPQKTGFAALKSKIEKWFVLSVRGFDPNKMTACTLVFEGDAAEVTAQRHAVDQIAKRHGGMGAGEENGRRGYQLTYGIAYIRDFVLNHWVLAESFETSVPWSQAIALCDNVKELIYAKQKEHGLPGSPFISCRVTQVYETGVCIYFYYAYYYKGVENPTEVYLEIEAAARAEILRSGGSLSHHHGVGKIRQRFLRDVMSPAALEWNQRTKQAMDPNNVFGPRNSGVVSMSEVIE